MKPSKRIKYSCMTYSCYNEPFETCSSPYTSYTTPDIKATLKPKKLPTWFKLYIRLLSFINYLTEKTNEKTK